MTPDTDRVRELLGTVDPPPARMMATDLLAAGRRARRRRRQWAVTGAACLATIGAGAAGTAVSLAGATPAPVRPAVAASTPAAKPAAPCVVERLDLPPGAKAGGVNTGSPSGRYLAGFTSNASDPGTPVRWDGGKAQAIRVPGTGEAQGVNDKGVVVGEGQAPGGRMYAWAYADGKVTELRLPAGYTGAEARGINATGQVTGVLFAGDRTAAGVWDSIGKTARVLDAPEDAMAFGISDSGVVVGGLRGGGAAYRWDAGGRGKALPAPSGVTVGDLHGVRGDWAYGSVANPNPDATPDEPGGIRDSIVAARWHLPTGRLTLLDGDIGAVNPAGQAAVSPIGRGTATIQSPDATKRKLPGLAGKVGHPYALSDDGTRAAGTIGDRPVRWICR